MFIAACLELSAVLVEIRIALECGHHSAIIARQSNDKEGSHYAAFMVECPIVFSFSGGRFVQQY
jgi:hypothetical protein